MATSDLFIGYSRNVRASGTSACVLAARLAHSAPADLTRDERAALARVEAAADVVSAVQSERERLAPAKLRPILDAFINAWSALSESLAARARLPVRVSPLGLRAEALATSLLPDGISFVFLDAPRAWSEGARRIDRIDAEGLASELTELVGADFIRAVRMATADLADAIGTGHAKRELPRSKGLARALDRFAQAVGGYARTLMARCDQESPASIARLRSALAPIDMHRAKSRSRSGGVSDEQRTQPVVSAAAN